tara:strand:- start:309 stop:437 length:129 start_codon:yes stop_codon:yes gene_type:complete
VATIAIDNRAAFLAAVNDAPNINFEGIFFGNFKGFHTANVLR